MSTEQLIDALKHGAGHILADAEGAKALGTALENILVHVARQEQQAKIDRARVDRVKIGTL